MKLQELLVSDQEHIDRDWRLEESKQIVSNALQASELSQDAQLTIMLLLEELLEAEDEISFQVIRLIRAGSQFDNETPTPEQLIARSKSVSISKNNVDTSICLHIANLIKLLDRPN